MKFLNLDVYKLNKKLKEKKLICFGAGRVLDDFINVYHEFGFEKKIEFIIDNDTKKVNTQKNIAEHNIKIILLERFCKDYPVEDFIIMITCADCATIYEQLEQVKQLNNVECCISHFVRDLTNETDEKNRIYPKKMRIYKEAVIPRVIHYCWFGNKEIPEQNRKWLDSWRKFCPDYKIVEWNEKNYDVTKNKYMHEAYNAEKWGFVSDYARLDIIFNQGGIYLDTDVELIKSLDELLYQDAFMGMSGNRNISLGLGFGARQGLEIIEKLRCEYDCCSFYAEDGSMDLTTVAVRQIPFFEKLGYQKNGEFQMLENVTIYPEKFLAGKSAFTGEIRPTKHTFAIHHYDASWVSEEQKMSTKRREKLFKVLCRGEVE